MFQEMGSPASASSHCDTTTSGAIDGFNLAFILGDFNYHAHTYTHDTNVYTTDDSSSFSPFNLETASSFTPNAQSLWVSFLNPQFFDCTHARGEGPILPTFRRGSTQSTVLLITCMTHLSFINTSILQKWNLYHLNGWIMRSYVPVVLCSPRISWALASGVQPTSYT